jgi:hypothetical protein
MRNVVPVSHMEVAVGRQPAERPAPRRLRAGERRRAVVLDQKVEEARWCHAREEAPAPAGFFYLWSRSKKW